MAKKKPIIDNIVFDSWEEVYLYWWAKELKKAGYIEKITLHPKSFVLSDKVAIEHTVPMKRVADKVKAHTILNGHVYTPDTLIEWTYKAEGTFVYNINEAGSHIRRDRFTLMEGHLIPKTKKLYSLIEVKPIFDQNNMTRLAKINQKWMYEKYGIFVSIIVPVKLFKKTFTPLRYTTCNLSSKRRKLEYKVVLLQEFTKPSSQTEFF